MPPKDLGTKHNCFKCGVKFYDLQKPEPICPKCGADQRESPALKAPPSAERRPRARPPVQPEEPVGEVVKEPDLEEEGEEAAEDEVEEVAEDEP